MRSGMNRILTSTLFVLLLLLQAGTAILQPQTNSLSVQEFITMLLRAETRQAQLDLLAAHPDLVTSELGLSLLKQGRELELHSEFTRALDASELTKEICSRVDNRICLADA